MDDRYPENWDEIARRVKDAADWRCENCGHPHDPPAGYTLTVHHLDMHPENCADENLVALCQRCHLHIQAVWKPGQRWLFDPPEWAVRRGQA